MSPLEEAERGRAIARKWAASISWSGVLSVARLVGVAALMLPLLGAGLLHYLHSQTTVALIGPEHRIGEIPRAHDGTVTAVALSTDGMRALTAGRDGRLRLWDAAGTMLADVDAPADPVLSLIHAPPEKVGDLSVWVVTGPPRDPDVDAGLASGGGLANFLLVDSNLTDARDHEEFAADLPQPGEIGYLAIPPERAPSYHHGRLLSAFDLGQEVAMISAAHPKTGERLLVRHFIGEEPGWSNGVAAVGAPYSTSVYDSAAGFFSAATTDGRVLVWDVQNQSPDPEGLVFSAIDPEAPMLEFGPDSPAFLRTLGDAFTAQTEALFLPPSDLYGLGNRVLFASAEGLSTVMTATADIVDETGALSIGPIVRMLPIPGSSEIVVVTQSGEVFMIVDTGQAIPDTSVDFSHSLGVSIRDAAGPVAGHIVVVTDDGVRFLAPADTTDKTASGRMLEMEGQFAGNVTGVAVAPQAEVVAASVVTDGGGEIVVVSLAGAGAEAGDGSALQVTRISARDTGAAEIIDIAVSADGAQVAVIDSSASIVVWRVDDPYAPLWVNETDGGSAEVTAGGAALRFSADGRFLLAATRDVGGLEILATADGAYVADVAGTPRTGDGTVILRVSDEGRQILVASDSIPSELWDLDRIRSEAVVAASDTVPGDLVCGGCLAIGIASDGASTDLITLDGEGVISHWDPASRTPVEAALDDRLEAGVSTLFLQEPAPVMGRALQDGAIIGYHRDGAVVLYDPVSRTAADIFLTGLRSPPVWTDYKALEGGHAVGPFSVAAAERHLVAGAEGDVRIVTRSALAKTLGKMDVIGWLQIWLGPWPVISHIEVGPPVDSGSTSGGF